jgi:hypothetical protein
MSPGILANEVGMNLNGPAGMIREARSEEVLGAEALRQRLLDAVRPCLADLKLMPTSVHLPDSSTKYLGFDRQGQIVAVVICSPAILPDAVDRNLELMKLAWCALGGWSDVILAPYRTGRVAGRSYAVFPYCRTLTQSRYVWIAQRAWIRPVVLEWLRGALATTVRDASDRERDESFRIPLEHLEDWAAMPIEVRSAASATLERFRKGLWSPRHCLMHGDLWKGNILLAPRTRGYRRFVLIDWGSSVTEGYGIYDLLRVASSMKVRGHRLRKEIQAHCELLGCDYVDARSHLVAALGHGGMNLGYFPLESYKALFLQCLRQLSSVGG